MTQLRRCTLSDRKMIGTESKLIESKLTLIATEIGGKFGTKLAPFADFKREYSKSERQRECHPVCWSKRLAGIEIDSNLNFGEGMTLFVIDSLLHFR